MNTTNIKCSIYCLGTPFSEVTFDKEEAGTVLNNIFNAKNSKRDIDKLIELIETFTLNSEYALMVENGNIIAPAFIEAEGISKELIGFLEKNELCFILRNKFWKSRDLVEFQVEIINEEDMFDDIVQNSN